MSTLMKSMISFTSPEYVVGVWSIIYFH
jgi:hypothetical protein